MALFFPTIEEIKTKIKPRPEPGELHLLEQLAYLDDSYEIYFQPFFNGDHPDVVILKKDVGAYIIEVKDYELGYYTYDPHVPGEEYGLLYLNNRKKQPIKTPFDQVMRYKLNIVGLYSESLKNDILYNKSVYSCIKTGVYFYNALEENAREVFQGCRNNNMKYISILGNDSYVVQDVINGMKRGARFFTEQIYKEMKLLCMPSFHRTEQNETPILDQRQRKLAESREGQRVKIKGVAGSGKTLVLAARAVNARERNQERVLILTFNITLVNYITDKISQMRAGLSRSDFQVIHFHAFVGQQINNYNISLNKQNTNLEQGDLDMVAITAGFEKVREHIKRYKTILIDEVQDFKYEWLQFIDRFFLEKDGELVVFGDEKQNIYDRQLEEKKVRTNILGRWTELNKSYRMNSNIAQLSDAFQKKYFANKYELDKIEIQQLSLFFEKQNMKYMDRPKLSSEELYEIIRQYQLEHHINSNDICILSGEIERLREFEYYLRTKKNLNSERMFETKEQFDQVVDTFNEKIELDSLRRARKLGFWMNSGKMKLCTIHSFKGWEAHTLFMLLDYSENELKEELIYTALTRCRKNLVVINVNDHMYSDFFKRNMQNK